MGLPPPLPPGVSQGSVPFIEGEGVVLVAPPPPGTAEGSTAYAEEPD
jgi:hypothetical protein